MLITVVPVDSLFTTSILFSFSLDSKQEHWKCQYEGRPIRMCLSLRTVPNDAPVVLGITSDGFCKHNDSLCVLSFLHQFYPFFCETEQKCVNSFCGASAPRGNSTEHTVLVLKNHPSPVSDVLFLVTMSVPFVCERVKERYSLVYSQSWKRFS